MSEVQKMAMVMRCIRVGIKGPERGTCGFHKKNGEGVLKKVCTFLS